MTNSKYYLHIAIPALLSGFLSAIFPSMPFAVSFTISILICLFFYIKIKQKINAYKRMKEKQFAEDFFKKYESFFKAQEASFKRSQHHSNFNEQHYKHTYEGADDDNRHNSQSKNDQNHRNKERQEHHKESGNQNDATYNKVNTIEEAFKILGVTIDASQKEIQRAFYKLMLKYHPDHHATKNQSEQEKYVLKTKQIIEARDIIFRYKGINI